MITLGHTAYGRTPPEKGSASRRNLIPDKTHRSQETDIHTPAGFEPQIPERAAADPRHRPRGHWDSHILGYCLKLGKYF